MDCNCHVALEVALAVDLINNPSFPSIGILNETLFDRLEMDNEAITIQR